MVRPRLIGNNVFSGFIALVIIVLGCITGGYAAEHRFRSVKLSNPDDFMAPPVIRMGSDDKLTVNFDELGENYSELRYRLVHCNSDWKPSSLVESEYLGGFNEVDIDDYAFSSNTFIHYVNYQITLPSENCPILHSGNYILEVYERDNPENILLAVRFMVSESIAAVAGEVTGRTDKVFNSEWQQLSLTVDLPSGNIADVNRDLNVMVMQNGVEHTRRILRSPSRKDGNRLVYDHLQELIFPAGNEYRRFENVSTSFPGMNTDSVKYSSPGYHVWIHPDKSKKGTDYVYDSTQHGRFLVREYNSTDSNLGADYVTVHFFLEMPEVARKNIYVDGEFTGNDFSDFNRMVYNRDRGGYETEILLKQGSYNYRYVAVDSNNGIIDASVTEGNMHDTQNEYWVTVYYRPPGARADRLIGFANILK